MLPKKIFAILIIILSVTGCAGSEDKRDAFFIRGQTLFRHKDFIRAEQSFLNAIRIDPTFANGAYFMGLCELKLNNWREARMSFEKAVQLNPRLYAARIELIKLLILYREFKVAREHISMLQDAYPIDMKSQFLSDILSFVQHDPDVIPYSFSSPPKSAPFTAALIDRLQGSGFTANNRRFEESPDDTTLPLLVMVGITIMREQGLSAEAVNQLLSQAFPDKNEWALLLPRLFVASGQADRAERLYKARVQAHPEKPIYHIMLAEYYLEQNQFDHAIAVLKTACSRIPDNLGLQVLYGNLYLGKHQSDPLRIHNATFLSNKPKIMTEGFAMTVPLAVVVFMILLLLSRTQPVPVTTSVFNIGTPKVDHTVMVSFHVRHDTERQTSILANNPHSTREVQQ